METIGKVAQPLSVKVSTAHVTEVVKPVEEKDPLLSLEDSSDSLEVEGEAPVEEDDIFAGDDAFISSASRNALKELEEAELEVSDSESEASDDLVEAEETDQMGNEGEPEQAGIFQIYKTDCLRCTQLVPDLKTSKYLKAKAFTECHYENDNENCPAKSVTVVVGIPIDKVVKSYLAAFVDGDNEQLARIQAKIASKDEGQRQLVNQAIKVALSVHLTKNK